MRKEDRVEAGKEKIEEAGAPPDCGSAGDLLARVRRATSCQHSAPSARGYDTIHVHGTYALMSPTDTASPRPRGVDEGEKQTGRAQRRAE